MHAYISMYIYTGKWGDPRKGKLFEKGGDKYSYVSYVITYGVFFIATYMPTFVIFWEKKNCLYVYSQRLVALRLLL